jgi:hypothetical protein
MSTNPANPEYLRPGEDEEDVEEIESSSALTAIEEADRSHMIRTAKQNPRSITKFITDLKEIACFNQQTAMEMMYSVPRDGKQLIGPSIGFAEAALAVWGNARAGSEVVETNPHEGYVVAEGRFYDCEKNVGRAIRKRRRIVAKKITPDSIQVTGDAACSIATREAILRSIPKPLWKPVWEQAKETALGKAMSVDQARNALVDVFKKMGITEVQLCNALQVAGIADIGGDEIIALQAWKKQLNEKQCTLEDLFGSPLDAEIEQIMNDLQWSSTKKNMSRDAYKGRREEHLAYLKQQAAAAGKTVTEKVTPIKQTEPKPEATAETKQEVVQQESKPLVDTVDKQPEKGKQEPPAKKQRAINWS